VIIEIRADRFQVTMRMRWASEGGVFAWMKQGMRLLLIFHFFVGECNAWCWEGQLSFTRVIFFFSFTLIILYVKSFPILIWQLCLKEIINTHDMHELCSIVCNHSYCSQPSMQGCEADCRWWGKDRT
jgi:hypothetical protein